MIEQLRHVGLRFLVGDGDTDIFDNNNYFGF